MEWAKEANFLSGRMRVCAREESKKRGEEKDESKIVRGERLEPNLRDYIYTHIYICICRTHTGL